MAKGRPRTLTREQIAEAMDVTKGTITRWEADGCPVARKAGRGRASRFILADVQTWRERTDAERAKLGNSLQTERALLAAAQRRKLEREEKVANKQLIPVEDVVKAGQLQVMAWRGKVLGLARRMVQTGAIPRESEGRAHEACRDLLTEISEWRVLDEYEAAAAAGGGK